MHLLSPIRFYTAILVLLLLSGCGGDNTSKDVVFVPDETNLTITVNGGISESFDNNRVTLTIPANAVNTDSTFVFTKTAADPQAKAVNIVSDIYKFSPDNLIFNRPFNLAIKVANQVENTQLSIARLVDGNWQTLPSRISETDTISAEISAFGSYAVKLRALPAIAKTIGPSCQSNSNEQKLRFIHVADLHSRFGFKERFFSRIKRYHQDALSEQPYTLFTNGGDDYEKGTVAEQTSQGLATMEAIKAMAFDVRVVGNHDYAWGPEQLLDYANDDNAIVLASNTQYEGDNQQQFAAVDFSVVQLGCLKVGFFGMTSVPWNELDEPIETAPIPDFIANFKMNWQWQDIAQDIVNEYRQDVDYMVMLSHLGEGTDTRIANNVAGIDLVLGGHTHGGENFQQLDNGALVIQPNFFAQGLTDLELTFDLTNNTVNNINYNTIDTASITDLDTQTQNQIDTIMGRYAPDANTEIGVSENYPSEQQLTVITALATQQQFPTIDAVLFDPNQVQDRWTPGTLTQEDFHAAFKVERQPSNTSGFNAIYQVSITGAELKNMLSSQPTWVTITPADILDSENYTVALQKGPAFNQALFFNTSAINEPSLLAEAWFILDQYARYRTSQCLYIDTDNTLNACKVDNSVTVWNFNDPNNPFKADNGPAQLNYFDPQQSNWGNQETQFKTTTELTIAELTNGPSGVMAFSRHSPTEGLLLTANSPANGDFKEQGLIADYTLVMDILWPAESDASWRALLQTDLTNLDDADLYFSTVNGIGITTRDSGYFGSLAAEQWHRIAFVFYAAPSNGALKIYLDGELVGVKDEGEIDTRWAINQTALLLSDNDFETKPGYLNALLFAGRAMTDGEIAALGPAQAELTFQQSVRTLNQTVKRHYQAAPAIEANLWLQQRSQFFNKHSKTVKK
ncbi:metallophosphoesterase [Pseudoalteromonas mariniglutinosa]|uniref:metallophosphoesterase n=1 Tax=Pseudoalteromonas mariniglutinosa TaxID=206042 RepID=UPI00384D9002